MYCFNNIVTLDQFRQKVNEAKTDRFGIHLHYRTWHYEYVRGRRGNNRHKKLILSNDIKQSFKHESAVDFSANLDDFQTLGWHQDNQNNQIDYCYVYVSDKVYFTENARQSYYHQMNKLITERKLDQQNYLGYHYKSNLQQNYYVLCKNKQIADQLNYKKCVYIMSVFIGLGVYYKMYLRMGKQIMNYRFNKYVLK